MGITIIKFRAEFKDAALIQYSFPSFNFSLSKEKMFFKPFFVLALITN